MSSTRALDGGLLAAGVLLIPIPPSSACKLAWLAHFFGRDRRDHVPSTTDRTASTDSHGSDKNRIRENPSNPCDPWSINEGSAACLELPCSKPMGCRFLLGQ